MRLHWISLFSRSYFLIFSLICIFLSQVLAAVDQHKPGSAGQQWYEKSWKPTTPINVIDSSFNVGRGRDRVGPEKSFGSGAGPVGDLDESASAIGEDDEDTEEHLGSGSDFNDPLDIGSGDISLPSQERTSSSKPTEPTSTTSFTLSSTQLPNSTAPLITSVTSADVAVATQVTTGLTSSSTPASPVVHLTTSAPKVSFSTTTITTKTKATTQRKTTTSPQVRLDSSSTRRTTPVVLTKEKPAIFDDPHKTTPTSFWMLPGVLAGLVGGAIVGLLAAILLIMFVVYRMRKKDEGSYALEEPKSPPTYAYAYQKAPTREFYA